MKKSKTSRRVFVCRECGHSDVRWSGRCPHCGAWNTMVEEKVVAERSKSKYRPLSESKPMRLNEIPSERIRRWESGNNEFDRVLGGGLVPGSLILIGGDPGIGKSTLMLQQLVSYAENGKKVLYVSGEESMEQIRLRADRLRLNSERFWLVSEIDLERILGQVDDLKPEILVVDSIQTVLNPELDSAPGSVAQVRESTMRFLQLAKSMPVTIFLIGHVTKEGAIAGPRVLEHMVDVLLFLEGDRNYQYRILRGIKNRFGSTNEIGLFELHENGMSEVENPSELFLSEHREKISGTAVTCALEGTRAILIEIQALTSTTSFGLPQRTATGIDHKRLSLLLAILEKRAGFSMGQFDVFVKVAGGLRVDDPSADLAVLQAVAAGVRDRVLDPKVLYLGEVGLGGEIRPVSQLEKRLHEADALGFRTAFIPKQKLRNQSFQQLTPVPIETIAESLESMG